MLATLIVATLFNCLLILIMTINFKNTNLILASNIVTNALKTKSITINNLNNYITIAIINVYNKQLSLFLFRILITCLR